MKSILLILLTFCISTLLKGQNNLVPNYSFEYATSCPATKAVSNAVPWFQPYYATDIYNTCQTSFPDVPDTWGGYNWPHTGNGFVGSILFADTVCPNCDDDREYIEVGLIDSLKQGKKYCVGFYTSPGNNNIWMIKNIQAVFTHDSLFNPNYYTYIQGVTIAIESPFIVSDTLNWTKVRDTYTAIGGERFITIGNFSAGNQVIHQRVRPYNYTPSLLGYYLFDDVSVYEQPDVFAGNDTLIHPGDTALLGTLGRADIFYSWQPTTGLNNANIANPVANPTATTQYILTLTDTSQWACNSIMHDTVIVTVGFTDIKGYSNPTTKWKVYPNPTNHSATLSFDNTKKEICTLTLYDKQGVAVQTTDNITADKVEIKGDSLQSGLYFYVLRSVDRVIATGKLILD